MKSRTTSPGVLVLLAGLIFAGVVGALLSIFPASRREIDFMAMGSVAVMLAILAVYSLSVSKADSTPKRRPRREKTIGGEFTMLDLDTQRAS